MNMMMRTAIACFAAGIAQSAAPPASAMDYKLSNGNQCVPANTSTAADFEHVPGGIVNITRTDQWVLCGIEVDSEDPPTADELWDINVAYYNSGAEVRRGSCVLYVGSPVGLTGTVTQTNLGSIPGKRAGYVYFRSVKRPAAHFLQPASVYCRVPPDTRIFQIVNQEWTATSS